MVRRIPNSRFLIFIAIFFFASFLGPGRLFSQTREISVKVLADEELREEPGWKDLTESCLSQVSSEFERLFGIRFRVIEFEDWTSNDRARSLETLAEELDARADKGRADILLAFTAQKNLDQSFFGYSLFKEGLVLSQYSANTSALVKTLKHEFGHLFGAVHVADAASVMDYFVQGSQFDSLNIQAVDLARERSFQTIDFPLPKKNRLKAIALYERICGDIRMSQTQGRSEEGITPAIRGVWGENWRDYTFYLDDAFLMLAHLHLENKDHDKTIATCQAALKINPANIETQNLMGIALRRKGLIEQAIEKYQDILRQKPGHPKVHYNLGIAYAKLGDLNAALSEYEKAIELKPNFTEAHNNLGEVQLRLGRIEDAEKELAQAVSLCSEYPLAHSNLAEVFCRKKDYKAAWAEAEKAIAMNPEIPDPYNIIGNIYHQQGRDEEAVKAYHKALSLDPGYEKAYFNLGICCFDEDRVGEAKKYFLKALEINRNFAEAHASLGYCLLREKNADQAIAEIERAQKLGFRPAKTHINLGAAYLQKGLIERAISEVEKALEIDPGSAMAYNNLGIAYMKKGMVKAAMDQFSKASQMDPKYKDPFFNLGNIYFQAGNLNQALDCYLQADRLGPNDGSLLNNIAVVYFEKAEYELSLSYVDKALAAGFKVHPDFLNELKKKIKGDSSAQSVQSRRSCC